MNNKRESSHLLDKLAEGYRKIKNNKNGKGLIIILLVGIFLMIVNFPEHSSFPEMSSDSKEENDVNKEQNTFYETDAQYICDMEQKLTEILSQMEGVGTVDVMISLKESAERVIEKDIETNSETENDDQRTSKSSSKKESTIFYGNSGELSWGTENDTQSEPYIRKEKVPAVEGVVIVASGGDSPVVVKNITEAVQALFGIETHKIRIVKKIS